MNESQANVAEFTVSELSAALKRTVEDNFGYVRVRGEISGYKGPHGSGHVYFALKDQTAKIDGVIWKGVFGRMRIKPEEGMEVIVTGKLTTYPNRSSYQIIVETLEPAGLGALMALLEERKRKLTAEGLFDEARKQLLPFLPEVIGVVTSPTGAVIRDILHRLADRFPRHVIVWPVKVQGDGSAEQVAAAIRGFNALPADGRIRRPDLLIVARGGGSLEDLWSFNEEIVVRAAAESMIPLISAVGHETDVTLIDFASDKRAPTPTAAAEMAVPVRADLIAELMSKARRALACWQRAQDHRRTELRAAARALPNAEELLSIPRQRLDGCAERLPRALRANAQIHHTQFSRIAGRLAPQLLPLRVVGPAVGQPCERPSPAPDAIAAVVTSKGTWAGAAGGPALSKVEAKELTGLSLNRHASLKSTRRVAPDALTTDRDCCLYIARRIHLSYGHSWSRPTSPATPSKSWSRTRSSGR
jgi:exodeoxyribonuclease VII large subunit